MEVEGRKRSIAAGLDDVALANFPESDAERSAAGITAMNWLLNSTSEQLYWMARHSRELILKR